MLEIIFRTGVIGALEVCDWPGAVWHTWDRVVDAPTDRNVKNVIG